MTTLLGGGIKPHKLPEMASALQPALFPGEQLLLLAQGTIGNLTDDLIVVTDRRILGAQAAQGCRVRDSLDLAEVAAVVPGGSRAGRPVIRLVMRDGSERTIKMMLGRAGDEHLVGNTVHDIVAGRRTLPPAPAVSPVPKAPPATDWSRAPALSAGAATAYSAAPTPPQNKKGPKGCLLAVLTLVLVFVLVPVLAGALGSGDSTPSSGGLPNGPAGVLRHAVEGGEAFKNVDQKVHDAHKDEPWYGHIVLVRPAETSLFDMYGVQIDTDLREESAEDTAMSIEICKAYQAAAAPNIGIVVNGYKTGAPRQQVDGTTRPGRESQSKMAEDQMADDVPVGTCGKS